jgi:hypothetical protein
MSATRFGMAGKTRTCPHCKATILDSASVCPQCQHHLRFDPKAVVERRAETTFSPLRVEGTFRHSEATESCEYSVVVSIRNERGEEIARRIVGVGALAVNEARTVTLSVDVFVPPLMK